MRWNVKRMILAGGGLLLLAAAAPARAAGPELPVVQSRDFALMAARLAVGARVRLENVQVAETGEARTLVLERFEVFTADAVITIHGDAGDRVLPAPANAYFRGEVDGSPGSRVFLAGLENGQFQGVIGEAGAIFLIGGDAAATKAGGGPLAMRRVDPALLKASRGELFNCGDAQLPAGQGTGPVPDFTALATAPLEKAAVAHTGRIAIESDFEFYQLFNSLTATTDATNYVGNLVGYASTIYAAELGTSLVVQSLSLWQTSGDPWTQTSTTCSLFEFGKYWNQNHTGVPRTTAHFLSGKASGGGVAWLNALCHGSFFSGGAASCPGLGAESTSWGGDYGYTGNLFGSFDINHPSVVWDIYAFSHELGHNFGSPHTHCYAGIGGNASPIDQCYGSESGCYSGATSTPGPAGTGSGTIMSYCHLRSGGYGNITLTFGTGFGFGVQPAREAAQMNGYIASVASVNPNCIAPVAASNILFNDGFESGTKASWQ
jgi:hypothetical protein